MTMCRISLILLFFVLSGNIVASSEAKDENNSKNREEPRTGWTFGALPAVSYNSDLGWQYGGVVNFYNFGDGSAYPGYMHSVYAEISRYTRGTGVNRLFYDSGFLIPGLRITADLGYYTERALDFYGFNGYNALYEPRLENEDDADYISRMFYRHDRTVFRFSLDLQGSLSGPHLRWVAGAALMNTGIAPVDIDALNEGRDEDDLLPDVPGLYDRYAEWGILTEKELEGGSTNFLKLGVVYDSRDNEPNPMSGIWSEVVLFSVPSFMGSEFSYSRISVTHRQYFTLVENDLSLACRLNYQGTVGGDVPFFMLPYMINSFSLSSNTDGLGGSRTLRGVLRNRVVGEGVVSGNFEVRWKFYRTNLFNQNFYFALNSFVDTGRVVQKREIDAEAGSPFFEMYNDGHEGMHTSLGGGLRVAMNKNFIFGADFGKPLDERDGDGGLYIGLNYLF